MLSFAAYQFGSSVPIDEMSSRANNPEQRAEAKVVVYRVCRADEGLLHLG
jgi:hypothetical protein